ncbi:MAG: Holliday junction branch migration protein RuvA [Bacteroidales bacterium]|nr:Holliday junction branch migration protein RuvA [Bacteroidales bacterium]MCF8454826.1 Holliday junction branch migration protein RuvA [Bacteroidales bacterium]
MFEFIQGKLFKLTPACAVLENRGIGYFINISLHTFSAIQGKADCQLFIHEVIREDVHLLFGFFTETERDIFRHLISVSGIGPNTGRMILSSMSPDEVRHAILSGNVDQIKSVKGIGVKTAQRLIIDLKDKVGKSDEQAEFFIEGSNTIRDEALSALIMLGFAKSAVEKVIWKIVKQESNLTVEQLIKKALKQL